MTSTPTQAAAKAPRQIFESIFAFPPNRDTLGGTAYLILETDAQGVAANLLVDCPALEPLYLDFIAARGGLSWLFITHRGGIGRARELQARFNCPIVIQEQEAYLLPRAQLTSFQQTFSFSLISRALWTPGHSPGSACLYYQRYGGVLFSGRHLLPNRQGQPLPLRSSKTFHWPRQLRSVQQLVDTFEPDTLTHLCPGASTGFLRGRYTVEAAYEQLHAIDLEACRQQSPLL
ncbi:MAG: MBL fold metallo-hydrolase [Leptolyngbya sp. SIO4C1]|nr:MBL fold metallo-hydrolase [Leptolyngbya sp. SIO4C1]